MTNRELAEALRLCGDTAGVEVCNEKCPFFKGTDVGQCVPVMTAACADALDNSETHIEALQKEIEKLRKQLPQWVSVKERMPERWRDPDTSELVNYLVYSPDFGVDVGNYHVEAERWLVIGLPVHVTHWAHLPEPPSTEGVE